MADQDTTEDTSKVIEDAAAAVETAKVEDEKAKAEADSNVDADTDKTDDKDDTKDDTANADDKKDDDGKDKTEGDDTKKFEKRFNQLKGETPEEYIASLEEAYRNSSTEAQRILKEAKDKGSKFDAMASIVAKNPEIAKLMNEATGEKEATIAVDPAVEFARDQMQQQMTKDYNTFTDTHPEFLTDDKVKKDVAEEVDTIGQIYEARGRKISLIEAMNMAWKNLGLDKDDDKESVGAKAKDSAAKGSPSTPPKKGDSKKEFSDDQLKIAKKMGLTPEQLAKYNK